VSRPTTGAGRALRGLGALLALAAAWPAQARAGPPAEGEPARPLLAGLAEVGTTPHLRAIAGLGRPFERWVGVLADGWVNDSMTSATLGARFELQAVNLDLHWRATRRFTPAVLPPLAHHTALPSGPGQTVRALDVDLWGGLPAPGGYLLWEGQATRLLDLPASVHVFDEGVHGIVRPPWSGLASLGWVADLRGGDLQVGGTVELAFLGRGAARRVRAGPLLSWRLSTHLDLRGQLLWPVDGPDRLPLWPSLGGGLALGWRDATGWPPLR